MQGWGSEGIREWILTLESKGCSGCLMLKEEYMLISLVDKLSLGSLNSNLCK
jgi:hypothetical protein